jgi:hypothetical protein
MARTFDHSASLTLVGIRHYPQIVTICVVAMTRRDRAQDFVMVDWRQDQLPDEGLLMALMG